MVICGASAGVGRACAQAFARSGTQVALLARGEAGLAAAHAEVEALGARAWSRALDVADAQAVEAAAAAIEAELGPIDVWVNNAMLTVYSPVEKMSAEEYRRVTEVTYLGTVHGSCAALRHMRARDRGWIIQVGSALAYRAIPLQSAYCAAKAAAMAFSDALRVELQAAGSRIQVTCVHLSAFNSPQFDWARSHMPMRARPVAPVFQPELAAQAIVWASRQRRREVHVGFPAVKAIWGNKLAPWFADWLLKRNGIAGQQSDEPLEQPHRDNLFEPFDVDMGAHGRFDAEARRFSLQFWLTRWRLPLAVLGGALLIFVLLLVSGALGA